MASKDNRTSKDKRKAKPARGKKKRKTKGKLKADKPSVQKSEDKSDSNQKSSGKRVAVMREKLKKSLEDPEMRDQIVRAIRTMMNEDR